VKTLYEQTKSSGLTVSSEFMFINVTRNLQLARFQQLEIRSSSRDFNGDSISDEIQGFL